MAAASVLYGIHMHDLMKLPRTQSYLQSKAEASSQVCEVTLKPPHLCTLPGIYPQRLAHHMQPTLASNPVQVEALKRSPQIGSDRQTQFSADSSSMP